MLGYWTAGLVVVKVKDLNSLTKKLTSRPCYDKSYSILFGAYYEPVTAVDVNKVISFLNYFLAFNPNFLDSSSFFPYLIPIS